MQTNPPSLLQTLVPYPDLPRLQSMFMRDDHVKAFGHELGHMLGLRHPQDSSVVDSSESPIGWQNFMENGIDECVPDCGEPLYTTGHCSAVHPVPASSSLAACVVATRNELRNADLFTSGRGCESAGDSASISWTGIIDAGGGGGPGGIDPINDDSGAVHYSAGGGGAGGNIVLQGAAITVNGQVFANGGGGGGGGTRIDENGNAGGDGARSATVAATGGVAICGTGGRGGAGGRAGVAPGLGMLSDLPISCSVGGGGGSVGYLQTYTLVGVTPALNPAAISPAFGTNHTVPTK